MGIIRHHVESIDDVKRLVADFSSKDLYILFSGAKDDSGKSWCPDCEKADPVIEDFLGSSKFSKEFHFAHVGIERSYWKNMENPFRKEFGLKCVPTLVKWGGPEKLEEDQCADQSYLEMLFEDSL